MIVINTKENSLIPDRNFVVGLIYGTLSLYYLQMKWNVIGIRTYLMKSHKIPSKMTNFLLFAIKGNEENRNNENFPNRFLFLRRGPCAQYRKACWFHKWAQSPHQHTSFSIPERSSPWTPHVTEKKPDKLLFSSTATLLSAQLEILKDNSWKRSMCLVEYTHRFIN